MLIMLAGRLMRAKGGEKRGRALLLLFLGEEKMGETREYDSRGSEKDRERRKESTKFKSLGRTDSHTW
jgi:hypothetical protein